MAPQQGRLPTEIAHVLFLDIVAYSTLPMEEQVRAVHNLRALVSRTQECERAAEQGDLISLDTGDGMALVFFRDPLSPVQCAIEITAALQAQALLPLRMGIHSGPVSRGVDINQKENVTGSGINMAQRVMDCGDAGHILVSKAAADILSVFEDWAHTLHDLGECQVKHDMRLHLFNLVTAEAGNTSRPARLRVPVKTPADAPLVAILYKRGAHPDEEVLFLLERELKTAGYRVFIDRHLTIGVEWAAEIDRQVRGADAVITLLSEVSLQSEMLEYEVQTAYNAAQIQQGKPRLLPVRLQMMGPLPPQHSLASILNPLQYTLWQSGQDDSRLVEEIIAALKQPTPPVQEPTHLASTGGALPLDSPYYIVRPTDQEFQEAVVRRDSLVLVKGARQMGKTSLMARGLQQARENGAQVVLTDFQALSARHLASVESLFLTLAEAIADQLNLDVSPADVWNEHRGANTNLERFLRRNVLESLSQPVVWAMDEVDRLFACDFGSEVFGLFRSWHNRRSLEPEGPWSQLTLVITYATEAHLFISDLNQSPFNVGTRLMLQDFTREEVAALNERYHRPLRSPQETARFYALVGGQPYLTQRGLVEMSARGRPLSALEAEGDREEGPFGDHLRRVLVTLSQDPAMLTVARALLRGGPCPNPESFYRLRSGGLLAGASVPEARFRCHLYETYLTRHLL